METRTGYRFTLEDEHAIASRVAETIAMWRTSERDLGRIVRDADHETLYRIGCHAIGCTDADLRDVERQWIRTHVTFATALKVPA